MIEDFIRKFLWALAQAVLMIGDAVYRVTTQVASFNIGELDTVWDYWAVLSVMIAAIAILRILTIGIKWFFDEQLQEKLNIIKIFGRVILVSLAIGLMPLGVKHLTAFGTGMIENIGLVTGHGVEMTPSTLIISSVVGDKFEVENEDGTYEIPKTYRLEDINEVNHKTDGEYTFFKTMGDLFVLLIMGSLAVIGLVLIAIEIAERFFRLGIKILIAPLPISALVDPDDDSFSRWAKLVLADVILNYLQLLSLIFILSVASSQFVRSKGVWVTLIMFIGGLFAVLKGTPELASIIGGDSSTQGAMQQLATIRQATRGMGTGVGRGARAVGRTAKKVGQGVKKGVRKTQDLVSVNTGGSTSDASTSGGSQSGGSGSVQDSGFGGAQEARSPDRSTVNTSSNSVRYQAEEGQKTENLNTYRSNLNVSQDSEGSGGLSVEEQSVFNGQINESNSQNNEQQGKFDGAKEARQATNRNYQPLQGHEQAFSRSENNAKKINGNQQEARALKESDPKNRKQSGVERANVIAQKIYQPGGNKFVRSSPNSGKHVYQKSDNKLKQTMPSRASSLYKNAVKDRNVERGVE